VKDGRQPNNDMVLTYLGSYRLGFLQALGLMLHAEVATFLSSYRAFPLQSRAAIKMHGSSKQLKGLVSTRRFSLGDTDGLTSTRKSHDWQNQLCVSLALSFQYRTRQPPSPKSLTRARSMTGVSSGFVVHM
jgi:hypothetical protein